jgi:hypothetical protein
MKPYRKFGNLFQIRWKENLGLPECPYLVRWTLVLFGYTIRLHHWIKSDDRRFFHDHSCDLISIVIKGHYYNITPHKYNNNWKVASLVKPWHPRKMKATQQHYLEIPKEGAWTIILCSRPYKKWGFYVNNHMWRPLRYFHKFGIIQTKDY